MGQQTGGLIALGPTSDSGSGRVLKTGSLRRTYNTKKKKKKRKLASKKFSFKYRKGNTTYKAGK